MKTKKFFIRGMHCVSCEKLLDDEFRQIAGVKDVRVDRNKNTGEVDYDGQEPSFEEIKKTAKRYGYDAFEDEAEAFGHPMSNKHGGQKTSDVFRAGWADWTTAIVIVVTLWILFNIFQGSGIMDNVHIGSAITFGVAVLVGLVASVSSCLVVVGSVIIAFGEKYKAGGNGFYQSAVKPNLMFHVGRLATFFVLGGLLGLIGGEINITGNFISIFTMIIAIVMAWLGLNILGIVPSISALGISMPKSLTKHWSGLKMSEHKAAPFVLGGLSFFLPCGFTQSMQIFALTSGSFWIGGATLFLFALGTVPVLITLGITTSWTKSKRMVVFEKVAGILVVLFAFYTLNSGLALKGVNTAILTTDETGAAHNGNTTVTDGKNMQMVEMHVTAAGFLPATLTVKKGVPVKWVIKGDDVAGCTNKIIVPSLNITKTLSAGDNVVEFTPTESGTIPFSCWMGMVQGEFIVK